MSSKKDVGENFIFTCEILISKKYWRIECEKEKKYILYIDYIKPNIDVKTDILLTRYIDIFDITIIFLPSRHYQRAIMWERKLSHFGQNCGCDTYDNFMTSHRMTETKKTGYRSAFYVSLFSDLLSHVMAESTNAGARTDHHVTLTVYVKCTATACFLFFSLTWEWLIFRATSKESKNN